MIALKVWKVPDVATAVATAAVVGKVVVGVVESGIGEIRVVGLGGQGESGGGEEGGRGGGGEVEIMEAEHLVQCFGVLESVSVGQTGIEEPLLFLLFFHLPKI